MNPKQAVKRISILGSGWLGVPLAESFMSCSEAVRLSTRTREKVPALQGKASSIHRIDIDNYVYDTAFFDCDVLIVNITSQNIQGFKQLIALISLNNINKVIFTSSTSVYQNNQATVDEERGPINLEHPLFQIEQLFRNNLSFKTTIIRLAGLIGGSRHPGYFFKNKTVTSPLAPVNLIHRDDCIAIIHSIISNNYWGETVNACADTHPSKKTFYSYARSLTNLPPLQLASDEINHYKIVSNAKIKTALNYQFVYPDLLQITFNEK